MPKLPENLLLQVTAEIHDPVTTTDELIPSGETSSFRSNPIRLAEFALSRKAPDYVGLAKDIQKGETAREQGEIPEEKVSGLCQMKEQIQAEFAAMSWENTGIGSTILQKSRETAQPESRQHPARRYWEAGRILPESMPQKDIVPI
mgnify:CR=1 FL=1